MKTLSQLILETLSHKFLTFCLAVSRTSCIYIPLLVALILVSLKDLETKLFTHNQKEIVSVHCIKAGVKVVLKNDFIYAET